MSKLLRIVVMAVVVMAILLFLLAVGNPPIEPQSGGAAAGFSGLLFWITATLVVSSFPVRTPRGPVISVSIAPILATAALWGPAAAAVVAFIGTLELRELRRDIPWYGTLYNHCSALIPAVVAGFTYDAFRGQGASLAAPQSLGAVLLAAAAYVAINETLAAAVVGLRLNRSPLVVLQSDLRAYGLSLAGLAPLSWLMALAYATIGPFVAVLFALPLYTTRASYQSVVEMRKMFTQTVRALASAIDARDPSTKLHSDNVSRISVEIGQVMGVSEAGLEQLEWGGLLHDIGKIGIRDSVLLKPDRLNKEERAAMNEHPVKGEEILLGVERLRPELPIILHHHQWYNGSGYPRVNDAGRPDPQGRPLVGQEIPFLARILHVADAFEAMTAVRPYRPRPLTPAQAMLELRKYSGIQFDPRVVEAFGKTTTAMGGEPQVLEPPISVPIPLIGQVAAMRSKGTISASVSVDIH